MKINKIGSYLVQLAVLLIGIIFISPILLTVMNSFKSMPEISASFHGLPSSLSLQNYTEVIKYTKYFTAFYNSALVCTVAVSGIILFSAMASYAIVRRNSKVNSFLYLIFVMGLVMPFTTIMVPTMKIVGKLGLSGRLGLIIIYWALGVSMAVFMFSGFIRSSVPLELEESARIDGASSGRIFFTIVLPLIKPSVVTIVMLDTIWIWNDFLLPSLMLSGQSNRTLPLSQITLVGQYVQKWNLQFAAFTLSMIPLFILFFTCQKHIIKGVAAGSVKG